MFACELLAQTAGVAQAPLGADDHWGRDDVESANNTKRGQIRRRENGR